VLQDLLPVKLKNQLQVWLLWADLNNSVATTDDSFEVRHKGPCTTSLQQSCQAALADTERRNGERWEVVLT